MPVRPVLLHRMALVSFGLFCKNLAKWFTALPGRKLPVRLWKEREILYANPK